MRQFKIIKQVTNRETLSLDKYLQEIGRVNLISPDEEVDLAKKIQQDDHFALNKLVQANLRFVVSVAKQYQNQGLSLSDLINEGNLGLIKAARRFDEKRGFKFISYAVWWIRQSILQSLAEQSRIVRLPLNKVCSINKINRASSRLEQKFGRAPISEEIAMELDITEKEVKDALRTSKQPISMDAPLIDGEREGNNLYDVLSNKENSNPEKKLLKESLQIEIEISLSTLTYREGSIVKLYYGLGGECPHTLEEIAEQFNLTQERVRQVKGKAINRLRNTRRSKNLKTFLG